MVLFGKEFDADEGAEVCWGLRGVESKRADLAAISFLDGLSRAEDEVAQVLPVVHGYADDGDFVGVGH